MTVKLKSDVSNSLISSPFSASMYLRRKTEYKKEYSKFKGGLGNY